MGETCCSSIPENPYFTRENHAREPRRAHKIASFTTRQGVTDRILILLRIDLTEVSSQHDRLLSRLGTCFFQLQIPFPPSYVFWKPQRLPVGQVGQTRVTTLEKKTREFHEFSKRKASTNMASKEILNSWNESGLLI